MKTTIFLEHRFQQTPDGYVWAKNSFSYSFWKPYFVVFSEVEVVGRVEYVDKPSEGYSLSSGEGVAFLPIPFYKGPNQFLLNKRSIKKKVRSYLQNAEHVILRVPTSGLSDIAFDFLTKHKMDYAVEVVADPYDVLSKGTIDNALRRVFQNILTKSLKRICKKAKFASYVTATSLQKRYPASSAVYSTWYSDVKISKGNIAESHRSASSFSEKSVLKIITVGTMSHVLYKAQDVLIKAFSAIVKQHPNVELQLVGDGENRAYLEELSAKLNVTSKVNFLGYVNSGQKIFDLLDDADLFVLPSRQEGLPRAMLEAFARAVPCVGSTVGGFPELLEPAFLVEPNDVEGLAKVLGDILSDPSLLEEMSKDNLLKSQAYSSDNFVQKRSEFYQKIAQNAVR